MINLQTPSPKTPNLSDSTIVTPDRLAWTIAEAADDRQAGDILLLRVADVSFLTDYFVIVTGYSKAQVRAIADTMEAKLEEQWQKRPLRIEGKNEASWILADYGDVIVHIMTPQARQFYNIEAFWGHAERIEFPTTRADHQAV